MEKMFEQMMRGFCGNMSEDEKRKMMSCCEKMAAFCPWGAGKEGAEAVQKGMMATMKSFCNHFPKS